MRTSEGAAAEEGVGAMSIIGNRAKLMRQMRNGETTIARVIPETVDAKEYFKNRAVIRAYDNPIPEGGITEQAGPITLQAETMEVRFSEMGITVRSEPIPSATLPEIGMSRQALWETACMNTRGFMAPYYMFQWSAIPTTYFPMTEYQRRGGGVFTITLSFNWNTMALPFVMDWRNSLPGLAGSIGRFRVGIRDRFIGVYPEGCYVPRGVKLLYEYDPASNKLVYVERGEQ